MIFHKPIFKSYIDNSYHVGVAITCLYFISCQRLHLDVQYRLVLFIFSGTVAMYNFIKSYPLRLEKNLILIGTHLFICLFTGLFLTKWGLILSLLIWLIGYLYITEIFFHKKNLRNTNGLIKIASVALSWTIVVVGLPISETINLNPHINYSITLLFQKEGLFALQIFMFVMAIMIPFEISDLKTDQLNTTLPYKIGIRKTKYLGAIFSIMFFLLGDYTIVDLTVCFIMIVFIHYSKLYQSDLFANFWVESIPIFWLILECIFYFSS